MNLKIVATLVAALGLAAASGAGAATISLSSGGANFDWNTNNGFGNADLSSSAYSDLMFDERWYLRTGGTTIQLTGGTVSASTADSATVTFDSVNSTITSAGLEVLVSYVLSEGALAPVLDVTTVVNNNSGGAMDVTLFNYFDYDIAGTFANDHAVVTTLGGDTLITITDQTQSDEAVRIGASVDHWEIDTFPSLRNRLANGTTTTLSDATSPFPDPTGFSDVTGAFQWTFLAIPDGGSVGAGTVSLSEPALTVLLLTGIVGLIARRRH